LQIDDGTLPSLQVPENSQGRELKMSKITVDKKGVISKRRLLGRRFGNVLL